MPKCAHHVPSTTLPDCTKVTQVAPKCSKACQAGYAKDYKTDKVKASNKGYSLGSEADVKKDIAR